MSTWVHMSGAGNVFLVGLAADAVKAGLTPGTSRNIVPRLSSENPRSDGAPIEGVLVVTPSAHRFDSEFYNPDGSHGMLCGNGARCALRFAIDHGTTPDNGVIPFSLNGSEYLGLLQQGEHTASYVGVRLPAPTQERNYTAGALRGVECSAYYVHVPSDHVVIDLPATEMRSVVTTLRHHEVFANGVNVNMVAVDERGIVNIATFERGVEAVTGACGTGAVASAVALWRQGKVGDHVVVRPPSGRTIEVHIHHTHAQIDFIELWGDANYDSQLTS